MSTFASYGRLEKAIAAADAGSIRARWEYGRRLLIDRTKTTAAGNLRNGVIDRLISVARRHGIQNVNRREIQYRIQAARTYPAEAHIAHVRARYENWTALREAAFPAMQLALDEDSTPFDPRTAEEKGRDAGAALDRGAEVAAGQLGLFGLFPADLFDEFSTLSELAKHVDEMAEWTARRARKDHERAGYLRSLIDAVGGDLSKTWAEADEALRGAA